MARKRNSREFWQSACSNDKTFLMYYNRLTELATSMFEWKNLPDTVDPRFLELTLYAKGQAVFFYDGHPAENPLGYLALNVAASAPFNVYCIPKGRRAYAITGAQWNLDESNSVMIYNNYLRTPSLMQLVSFADRLGKIDEIIDININAQKTPILILADESKRLTMKNLYMKYDGNQPFIFGDKNLSINDFTVLKTDAPYVADKLYEIKTQIFNEALTYLGISNTSLQKKERLITDEVSRNMGGTIAARYNRLNERQKACEKINSLFGLNVWCEYKEDYDDRLILEDADDVMYRNQTEEKERKEENNE